MTDKQKEVMRNIIYAVETGGQVYGQARYDDFTEAYTNSSNEHAITIGAGQWYGTEAQRLLKLIRSTDLSAFVALDYAGIGSDIDTTDWNNYRIAKTSNKAKCIVSIIDSAVGHKCQDKLVDNQMEVYIAEAAKLGVTAIDAQMMCANFRHQGGYSAMQRVIGKTKKPYTLDNLYEACKTDTGNQVGAYKSRQKMVYESLKKYVKDGIVQQIIDDAVEFAVQMANDNKHGYSQAVRSLYNITNPTSFDCSSLVCTAFYYAFVKNGVSPTPKDLGCTYTGNMLNLLKCGFEVVATNQTAHSQMQKGDIELHTVYHTAMAIDNDNIVHARSSEGTANTADDSGNEIRTQPWYLYSHGWTHRLRFTGKGIVTSGTPVDTTERTYMFKMDAVQSGSAGNHVLLVQEILRARGYKGKNGMPLELDKECGDNTSYAIKQYQRDREKQSPGICGGVDGIAGEKTLQDMIAL